MQIDHFNSCAHHRRYALAERVEAVPLEALLPA